MASTTTLPVNAPKNGGEIVGEDIQVAQIYVRHQPSFFIPLLDPYIPPVFTSPPNIVAMKTTLQEQNIIVLGGSREIDKAALSRHLAWYFVNDQQNTQGASLDQSLPPDRPCLPIKEWYRSDDRQSLWVGLQEEEPAVFILAAINAQEIGYDLHRLQTAARTGGHYIIVGSDTPFSGWKLAQEQANLPFWCELDLAQLYPPSHLAEILIQALLDAANRLPVPLSGQRFTSESILADGLTLLRAVELLRTPGHIHNFVEMLCQYKKPLKSDEIWQALKTAQETQDAFHQWFQTILQPREQWLTIGLGLFDGLLDDQFFTAFEQVITTAWREREPGLVLPDYHDLDNLEDFYRQVKTQTAAVKIESRIPNQRQAVMRLAWKSHRRKLLAALPVLQSLAQKSIHRRASNPSLYGDSVRRNEIRRTISEALSDIGLISAEAIEDILIEFASDEDSVVQAITGRALARWRVYERDDALFDLLEHWKDDTRLREAVTIAQEGREQTDHASPEAYIRATIALTAGYAAQYDPTNQMPERLIKLLLDLAADQNSLVRSRFRGYTLPTVVPLHLSQVAPVLHDDLVRYIDLVQAIGASLGKAYRFSPEEVIALLDAWEVECEQNRPGRYNPDHITHRDAVLAAIAFTYGQIEYGPGTGPLTADRAFTKLQRILENENHPFVRNAVVLAITFQAQQHFTRIEPQLKRLVMEVTPNEREEIVKIFSSIYLQQRADLAGGDDVIEKDGREYAIWLEAQQRPLTAIEKAMFRWLNSDGNPIARQIATQSFVLFASQFDQDETREIYSRRIEAQRHQAVKEDLGLNARARLGRAVRQSTFMMNLVGGLVTLNADRIRQRVQEILPEAMTQRRRNASSVEFVLNRWRSMSDSTIRKTAFLVQRAIRWLEFIATYAIPILLIWFFLSCCGLCTILYLLMILITEWSDKSLLGIYLWM